MSWEAWGPSSVTSQLQGENHLQSRSQETLEDDYPQIGFGWMEMHFPRLSSSSPPKAFSQPLVEGRGLRETSTYQGNSRKRKNAAQRTAQGRTALRGEEFSHHMSDHADRSDTESHFGAANGGSEEAAERWWAQRPELPGSHRA